MLSIMLDYIKDSTSLNQANHLGKTPIVHIAESANREVNEKSARMLLAQGANPRAGEVNPLMAAIREKNYRVMRVLYEHGV